MSRLLSILENRYSLEILSTIFCNADRNVTTNEQLQQNAIELSTKSKKVSGRVKFAANKIMEYLYGLRNNSNNNENKDKQRTSSRSSGGTARNGEKDEVSEL